MGRYNSNKLSSKFVQNYIKNRLWQRDKAEYVPFLNVRSVPSKGKVSRVIGWKTGREHHFLSKLELAAFYHFDWSDYVIDIKEQYPLLPMEVLENTAIESGIEYPSFNGEHIIMTTDFFLTVMRNGKKVHYVRTIKPSSELSNERIIEKFEIEKRFFSSKGIDWGIITEKELSDVFTNNMEILHSNRLVNKETSLEKEYIFSMYKELINGIEEAASGSMPMAYILTQLSRDLNVNFSDVNEIFFKAIVDKVILLDIHNKPLNINTLNISDAKVNSETFLRTVNSL